MVRSHVSDTPVRIVVPHVRAETYFGAIYADWIRPNMLQLIVIGMIVLVLIIRSYTESLDDEPFDDLIRFNPSIPLSRQRHRVGYAPDGVPVRTDTGYVFGPNSDQPFRHDPDNNDSSYRAIRRYDNQDRETVTGTDNRWIGQPDSLIPHPYAPGYANDYVSSTARSIEFSVDANRRNMADMSKRLWG